MGTVMVLLVCYGYYWWDVESNWNNAQNTLGICNGFIKKSYWVLRVF